MSTEIPPTEPTKPTVKSDATPLREKVVELAIQLVSAQIAAISNHQTITATSRHLLRLLIDVADSFSRTRHIGNSSVEILHWLKNEGFPVGGQDDQQNPGNDAEASSDRPLENKEEPPTDLRKIFGEIAQSLRAIRSADEWYPKPELLGPLGNNDLDDLFTSAMHRVERMLTFPHEAERKVVFAEQLFEPLELLSENKIHERFRQFGWPGLAGKDNLTDLMTGVDAWFTAAFANGARSISVRNDDASEPRQGEEADLIIRTWQLCNEASSNTDLATSRQYREASEAIAALIRARDLRALSQITNRFFHLKHQALILLMFGGSAPKPRPAKSPKKEKRQKVASYRYRPWAIFRYLRRYGTEDEDGIKLNKQLAIPLHELSRERTPEVAGLVPREFEFGPLDREVEDFIEEQEYSAAGDFEAEGEEEE